MLKAKRVGLASANRVFALCPQDWRSCLLLIFIPVRHDTQIGANPHPKVTLNIYNVTNSLNRGEMTERGGRHIRQRSLVESKLFDLKRELEPNPPP